jgi:hypothetical protein
VEVRFADGRIQIIDAKSGHLLQEDFAHGCVRCPLYGRRIALADVDRMLREAVGQLRLLQCTIADAQGVGGGGGR